LKKDCFLKYFSIKRFEAVIVVIALLLSSSIVYAKNNHLTIHDVQNNDFDDSHKKISDESGIKKEYGGPVLDFDFIYKIVENLSNIVKKYPMGRAFGTPGEHEARDLVKGWMEEAGLENVHLDKIKGEWTKKDSWQNIHNFLLDPDYYSDPWIEELDLKKNFTKWYLNVKVYDKSNNLVDQKYLSRLLQ